MGPLPHAGPGPVSLQLRNPSGRWSNGLARPQCGARDTGRLAGAPREQWRHDLKVTPFVGEHDQNQSFTLFHLEAGITLSASWDQPLRSRTNAPSWNGSDSTTG